MAEKLCMNNDMLIRDRICVPGTICKEFCRFWIRPVIFGVGLISRRVGGTERTVKKNGFSVDCKAPCLSAKEPAESEQADIGPFELNEEEIKAEHNMRIVMTKAIKHNKCRMFRLRILPIYPTPLFAKLQFQYRPDDNITVRICLSNFQKINLQDQPTG